MATGNARKRPPERVMTARCKPPRVGFDAWWDAVTDAMDEREERERAAGSCATCSLFHAIPSDLCTRPAPWGWCEECDRYVCGDDPMPRTCCEGEAYDPMRAARLPPRSRWIGAEGD